MFAILNKRNVICSLQSAYTTIAAELPCVQIADGSSPSIGWIGTETNGAWTFASPTITPVNLKTYAASVRYAKETGGFIYQTHPIATDESSQSKIGNAALGATVIGSGFSTDWKCSDGSFVTLNQSGMMGMATDVLNFINACYAAEAEIDAAITAGSITTTTQIDGYNWPTNSA